VIDGKTYYWHRGECLYPFLTCGKYYLKIVDGANTYYSVPFVPECGISDIPDGYQPMRDFNGCVMRDTDGTILYEECSDIPDPEPPIEEIKYGLLYNWYAALDPRNLSAEGWHVAYYNDWRELFFYLDPDASEYSEPSDPEWQDVESNIAGGPLKETGLTYWNSPNTGATNEVGFNARGSGWRGYDWGLFYELGQVAMFFCGDDVSGLSDCFILYDDTYVYARRVDVSGYFNYRRYGFSIRLCRLATEAEQGLDDGTACDLYVGNDLKVYPTIKIGTKVWLAANLAETKFRTGEAIPEVTDNAAWAALTSGALCAYDNDWNNV
jgi:uncharacterized protein (TIGR02145 family)